MPRVPAELLYVDANNALRTSLHSMRLAGISFVVVAVDLSSAVVYNGARTKHRSCLGAEIAQVERSPSGNFNLLQRD